MLQTSARSSPLTAELVCFLQLQRAPFRPFLLQTLQDLVRDGFGLALLQGQAHLQALRQQCQTLFDPSLQGLSGYQLKGLAILQTLAQEAEQHPVKQTRGPLVSGALALVLLSHVKEEAYRKGDGGHAGREVGEDKGKSLNGQSNSVCI